MSKIDKLRMHFYGSPTPKDITVEDVARLAKYYGCIVRSGGKHQVAVVNQSTGVVVPLPQHAKEIKVAYVKELRELFNDEELKGK